MKRTKRHHSLREIFLVTLAAVLILASDVFLVSVGKVHARSSTDLSDYLEMDEVTETTKAMRGTIYDRNGTIIAQDNRTYNIVCILDENRPTVNDEIVYVKDKEYTADVLSKCLRMDKDEILGFLNQDVYQTELGMGGRKIPKSVKDEIESYHLPGIEFTDSIQRVYPLGQFATNLIGYAQSDESGSTVGMMGLELYLNSYLSGKDGSKTYQVDKNGYVLPGMKQESVSEQNGANVTLTIDADIQAALEDAFIQTKNTFHTDRAWGAVMEVDTGKVVGWGQATSFNPNTLEGITDYTNLGAQTPYEPGSTMKPFTYAAAINEGRYDSSLKVDGNSFCYVDDANFNPVRTYDSENAYGCVYNAWEKKYGNIDIDYGLIYSLNTVTAAIQNEMITPDIHLNYLDKFGFFKPVNTDGLPENAGTLNFTYAADKVNLSFGQGSTVTMLQMLQAYSAIFNNGTMVKPYFVDSIRDSYDNSLIYQAETTVVGNPITEETAKTVQDLLYRTVNSDDGTARFYKIPECSIIAKTGTAEIAINGSYDNESTIASIAAAMPADDPKVVVYYAFQVDSYDYEPHYQTDSVKSLLRRVAMSYGFVENGKSERSDGREETDIKNIEIYKVPGLTNHSVAYAGSALEGLGISTVVLGSGNTVIDQFPKENDTVVSGQRVFLLTDTGSFAMPDMTGWTRKDVAALWSMTGFGFILEGSGKVVSQNIPPGTVVTKGTEIIIKFSQ